MFSIFSPTKLLDQLILMQIVTKGPLHGYALTAAIEEKFNWKPSQTAVYNSLKSLEGEGYVISSEKIESGRLQKIYSLTDKGKEHIAKTHQKIRAQMMNNFKQFFSIAQLVNEVENKEESDVLQQNIHDITNDFMRMGQLSVLLVQKAPKELQKFINDVRSSLEELAEKYDVKLSKDEKKLSNVTKE